jgi:hypothetical protein
MTITERSIKPPEITHTADAAAEAFSLISTAAELWQDKMLSGKIIVTDKNIDN